VTDPQTVTHAEELITWTPTSNVNHVVLGVPNVQMPTIAVAVLQVGGLMNSYANYAQTNVPYAGQISTVMLV